MDPTLALLRDLVAIDSVNPSLVPGAAGEAAVAARIADELRAMGLDVEVSEIQPGRPNVVGVLDGRAPGRTLMYCGHTDTVSVEGMARPFDPIVRSIQTQSSRLRMYLESAPPLDRPARNPFRFFEPAAAAPGPARAPALSTASAMTAVSRPGMTLAGVAEDPAPNGPVRTAIIVTLGQLFVVKVGDTVARRFRVVGIGADSAQLSDLTDGTAFTLTLR